MRAVTGAGSTATPLQRHELSFTSLTPKETNPTQTEIGEFEVTMLVDEKVIGFQITKIPI